MPSFPFSPQLEELLSATKVAKSIRTLLFEEGDGTIVTYVRVELDMKAAKE